MNNLTKILGITISTVVSVIVPFDPFPGGGGSTSSTSSVIISSNSSINTEEVDLKVNTDWVAALDNNCLDFPFDVVLKSRINLNKVSISFMYGVDENNIGFISRTSIHSLYANQEDVSTFTFPSENLLDYGRRYFRIMVYHHDSNTELFNKDFYLNRPEVQNININANIGSSITSYSYGFKIENNELKTLKKDYDFRETIDFIDSDYYYRLDLKNIYFKSSEAATYKSIELKFDDEDNLFPEIGKANDGYIHLPLEIENKNSITKTFKFKKSFYVDKRTLKMSTVARLDYLPTSYFYLPINKLKLLSQYKFTILIKEYGYCLDNLTLTLDFDLSKRLVGKCSNSEYCIVGGIVK